MKIRKGFISNSSSSSFICDICGTMESGYHSSASELGFAELPCGHTICESEVISISDEEFEEFAVENLKKDIEDYQKDLDNETNDQEKRSIQWSLNDAKTQLKEVEILIEEGDFDRDNYKDITEFKFVIQQCPICTNKVILAEDLVKYLLNQSGKTRDQIVKEIQKKFTTRQEILDSIEE